MCVGCLRAPIFTPNDAEEENAELRSLSTINTFVPHLTAPRKFFSLTGTFLKLQSDGLEHNREPGAEHSPVYGARSGTLRQQQRSGRHGGVSPPMHVICLNLILFEVETHWPL